MATAINLLPDVRQEKVRAKRRRQTAAALATVITCIALGLVLILFLITQGQKIRIAQLQADINDSQAKITADKDLVKIVTTQQHLKSLPDLYRQRTFMTKFYTVLGTVSPKDYDLETITVDDQNTIKFTGKAKNYYTVTKFAKALEGSNLTLGLGADVGNQPYFTDIKLDTATADASGKVSFTLSTTMSKEVTSGNK
ncbi:MAG TPA: hypothetical protein VLF41_01395 [Candidatus Nanoarchaeia archaeon]|nr:hypothetical protein [Candidatus Nanoarchaeia archaeon]